MKRAGAVTPEAICAAALAAAPRNPLLRHPFFRAVYIFIYILSTLLLLPFWSLYYIPRANRPRRRWDIKRCLRVRWSRMCCALVARCEIDYLGRDLSVEMDPAKLKDSLPVTIPAAPPAFLLGHIATCLNILNQSQWNPPMIPRSNRSGWGKWERKGEHGFVEVQAFWFGGPPQLGDLIGLHFHGGGYICGTAAETDLTSTISKSLVKHSPINHILSVDYRLAPTSPWPLPLLDAISAYHHLTQTTLERDIVLIGDSAGGHLALALMRWIQDEGKKAGLKGPRALVLMSPWVDVGFSTAWNDPTFNAASDTIDDTFGPFATSLLMRALPSEWMHTEYLSPASLLIPPPSFAAFPPVFLVHGDAERISPSIHLFWDRLRSSRTSNDKHVIGADCVHDFMIFPWQSEEAAKVYFELDAWLRDLLADDIDPCASPEILASPNWARIERSLEYRRNSRISLKSTKSPVLAPTRPGAIRMVSDMKEEAKLYLPPLDLDSLSSAASAKDWFTPFTSQVEGGEWDWGEEKEWYDSGSSETS